MGRHGELVREGSARLATTKFILACILQITSNTFAHSHSRTAAGPSRYPVPWLTSFVLRRCSSIIPLLLLLCYIAAPPSPMLLSSKVTTQGLKETIVPCDLELEDYAFQFLIIVICDHIFNLWLFNCLLDIKVFMSLSFFSLQFYLCSLIIIMLINLYGLCLFQF